MASTDSKLLGSVLGKVLKKEYPLLSANDTNDWITLDVLLSWVLWPNYLKIVQQGIFLCLSQFSTVYMISASLTQKMP